MENGAAELAKAWRSVLADLQVHQRAWLRASQPVTLHETTAIIAVPNEFTRAQLEGRLRSQLEGGLSDAFGHDVRIAITIDPSLPVDLAPEDEDAPAAATAGAETFAGPSSAEPEPPAVDATRTSSASSGAETRLNPKYTFETFVIGSSNRFPHAAAVAVAEAPTQQADFAGDEATTQTWPAQDAPTQPYEGGRHQSADDLRSS